TGSPPKTRVTRPHDRLSAAADAELAEDDRHVVANGTFADTKSRTDRVIVEALCHQLQHVPFACCEMPEHAVRISAPPGDRRSRQKVLELADELFTCRLGLDEELIAAFEWDEAGAGNERRERAALVERCNAVAAGVEYDCGAANLRRQIVDVDLNIRANQI